MKILLISSESIYKRSSRLALDQYNALCQAGHHVDILTKYAGSSENLIGVCKQENGDRSLWLRIKDKIVRRLNRINQRDGYYFFYKKETQPPIDTNLVLSKIERRYDLVLITFWQELLSAETVYRIYLKVTAPIFFLAVDMSPMTGGCHYFWNCMKFTDGCGRCPGINSVNREDFTHFNLRYKREKFQQINCVFVANDYMNSFARKSSALKSVPIEHGYIVINENEFTPCNGLEARKELRIDPRYKFIMFAGAQALHDSRKGMPCLVDSLNIFYESLTECQRTSVLILFAGKEDDELSRQVKFDNSNLGFIGFDILPKAFNAANVFLSPSLVDAGPMMVNQSLSCGTPVVAYDIGIALEVVIPNETGYRAPIGNAKEFARGIKKVYDLNIAQREKMANRCREVALTTTSYDVFSKRIVELFIKYKR